MPTPWSNPSLVDQYAEEGAEQAHIRWDDSNGYAGIKSANGSTVGTLGNLFRIARSPKPDLTNKTYYIRLTGYLFVNVPDLISGIELKIQSRRAGRVVDDTVQLTHNGQLIGDNQANLEINPTKLYGGVDQRWGVKSLSKQLISDVSFGVVLRFASHPNWPHRDPVDLDSVQLRLY